MAVRIRNATIDDLDRITEIYAEAVLNGNASFETDPPNLLDMQSRFNSLRKGNYPYFIAEIDGQLAGYAYAGPYRTRPAYGWSVENSVYVDPQFQGRKVGKLLLEKLLKTCTQSGFRQIIAVIGDSENHASVGLHRTCGFNMVGTIKDVGRKHGRWLDTVIMQKALGDGSSTPPNE